MRKLTLVLLSFATLLFITCKKDSTSDSGAATMNVYLTDDPGDYDQVNVDVVSVEVHTDANGWTTLATTPGIYNLLDYTNGLDTLLATATLPAGEISQVRLNLGTNNTIMVDSVIYPLDVPSGYESGLKINIHQTLAAGTGYALVLDFDAAHSIVETGNGDYKLKPVIHATMYDDYIYWGTISGVVLPVSCGGVVWAVNGSDSLSTYTNPFTGQFQLQYLTAGVYTITVDAAPTCNDTTFTMNVGVGENPVDTLWLD
jgi:hypothetical protein